MCFNNRIYRTAFFAESAKNAFSQIDVVAGSPATAVIANFRLNRDGQCWANGLAQFAGNAALFTIFLAAQRMQAAKTRALRRFLFRKLNCDLSLEHVLASQSHAFEQFSKHEA